jgi:tetratricopeptide (TPR) repeat protein
MRKNFLKFVGIFAICLTVIACSNISKMAKNADAVKLNCNPLVNTAGKINVDYSISFPAEFFNKKAVVEVLPVLKFEGKEVAGPVFTMQGEKVLDNNHVVPFATASTVNRSFTYDYEPGMESAVLEFRAAIYNADKSKVYATLPAIKAAEGVNCTYMLVETEGVPSFQEDAYQKIIKESKESQILYTVNQSNVRRSELKSQSIKDFQAYLKEIEEDERRTLVSNDIIAYASPEGAEDLNTKLSNNRAKTAETAFVKTITKKYDVKDVPLNVSQISEDWEGFQELVSASDVEDKELILRVLSMYSDPSVREREIRNMSSVFKTLADKVLPALRRARFVANVEYKNWTDEELVQIINENIDKLDEEALLYGASLFDKNDAKVKVYEQAAKKYNSSRAYNNLAALSLAANKTAEAKAYLSKMTDKGYSYYNNMAVVAMQEKNYTKAAEYLQKAGNGKEANQNLGALYILNGKYQKAYEALAPYSTFNSALAGILVNNYSKVGELKCKCPKSNYLRAIAAARQGKNSDAKAYLEEASKNANLAKRAKTDVEFAKL